MSETENTQSAAPPPETPAAWPDGEAPLRVEPQEAAPDDGSALIVDVGGFEGPLDLLLELARHHKIGWQSCVAKLADGLDQYWRRPGGGCPR